jgi:hypothetical protein
MLDMLHRRHVLGPRIRLRAQHVLRLRRVKLLRHRLERVDAGEVAHRHASGGFAGAVALQLVEIQVRRGRQHHVMPFCAALIAPFVPRHDITVASAGTPPSRISSQPINRRPCASR